MSIGSSRALERPFWYAGVLMDPSTWLPGDTIMTDGLDWLASGIGAPPTKRWSFQTDAPLIALVVARESGETLIGDASGGLYRFDRSGQLAALSRGFHALSALAYCDAGAIGFAAIHETRLSRFDRQFKVDWSIEMPEPILAVATDSHGNYVAASMVDGRTFIYDQNKRKKTEFATLRPLRFLEFLTSSPDLVVSADYWFLARHELLGRESWSEKSGANVGAIAATGDGERIFVAGFTHGIRLFDGKGRRNGAWLVEGTVSRLHCSFDARRIAAATLERHIYWLDAAGNMVWGGSAPEDVVVMRCDALGQSLTLGFQEGRVLALDWSAGS